MLSFHICSFLKLCRFIFIFLFKYKLTALPMSPVSCLPVLVSCFLSPGSCLLFLGSCLYSPPLVLSPIVLRLTSYSLTPYYMSYVIKKETHKPPQHPAQFRHTW